MAIQVQIRRDAVSNLTTFTPAQGELVMDTSNKVLLLGDGATPNGLSVAKSAGPNGSFIGFKTIEAAITGMSGATAVSAAQIPANSLVLAVSALVTTAITGATSFEIGATTASSGSGAGPVSQFGTCNVANASSSYGLIGPTAWYAASTITLTAVGGNFTAGAVRLAIQIITIGPPTS